MTETYFYAGLVGSRDFEDYKKVSHVVKKLKFKVGKLCVVSGGCNSGADKHAKQAALNNGIPYQEFTPEFREPNIHTVQDESEFGKDYSPGLFHKRNRQLAEYCDVVIAFIPEEYVGDPSKSTGTRSTLEYAEEAGTPTMILK
jgi:predicted Rossmann-fold nucleotide-binding protein